jgi:hypothetical protein
LENLPAIEKYVELFWKFNVERMEKITKAKNYNSNNSKQQE